jgi:hypothetical protein
MSPNEKSIKPLAFKDQVFHAVGEEDRNVKWQVPSENSTTIGNAGHEKLAEHFARRLEIMRRRNRSQHPANKIFSALAHEEADKGRGPSFALSDPPRLQRILRLFAGRLEVASSILGMVPTHLHSSGSYIHNFFSKPRSRISICLGVSRRIRLQERQNFSSKSVKMEG